MRATRISSTRTVRAVVPLVAALCVLVLAGCGSSAAATSPAAGNRPTSTTAVPPRPTSKPVAAHPKSIAVDIVGAVTDPGPAITDVTSAASQSRFTLTGGSHWSGDLEGDTTYTGPGIVDPASGDSDVSLRETFTGSLKGVGSGSLVCDDFMHNNADGSGSVDLWVVRGRGHLRGLQGHLRFTWTSTNPDGSINGGEFHGVLYGD